MRHLTIALVRFLKAEDGPTAVEYAVMLALIIVACAGGITMLGGSTKSSLNYSGSHIPSGS